MKNAIKTYNGIMFHLCLEFLTIGTNFSENNADWNLRDMVAEMDYQLHHMLDETCSPYQDAHQEDQPTIKVGNRIIGEYFYDWQKSVARMRRFIAKYEDQVANLECSSKHCSRFD
jgi:hypothetical protein